jgi:signal transduction histidine kinase
LQEVRRFWSATDQIVADLPSVAASTGHELLMIVREAFANAGLHAHANQVRLEALMKGANLYIDVADNGKGGGAGCKRGTFRALVEHQLIRI